jgi:glycosyltransferase involved in cell wall biosynthesis
MEVMKVSFTGAPEYMDRNVGYGEASRHIIDSFENLGVECLIKDRSADIGISFIQPTNYTFAKDQYKIGYTPWESTELLFGWDNVLDNVIDELWTTSQWCADIFAKHTDKPIFVYEHGIQDSWIPKKRNLNQSRPFRFLHIGEPSFRKDAQSVVDAFVSLFGNDPNYELILKCSRLNTTRIVDKSGQVIGSPSSIYSNIKIIESMITTEQINGLYDSVDVFVYPSWGEGFGFNPLQAMAKGIPTICTGGWATYERYITMPLDSTWTQSPWEETHPGLLLKPSYAQLKFFMQDVTKNYDSYSDLAYKNAFLVHKDYNWSKVSKPAVERLKKIQSDHF